MDLSTEQEEIILERHRAYEMGDAEIYSLEELEAFLDYSDL